MDGVSRRGALLLVTLVAACESSLAPRWALDQPRALSAAARPGGVHLVWAPVELADSYALAVTTGGDEIRIATTGTAASLRGLASGVEHRFAVRALRGSVESAPSPDVAVVPFGSGWAGDVFSGSPDWTYTGVGGSEAGSSAAIGDLDGDGFADLALGHDDGGTQDEGEVLFFAGSTGGLAAAPRPERLAGLELEDEFGDSVTLVDHDGDSRLDVLVGVNARDGAATTNEGAFVLFSGAPGPWPSTTEQWILPGEQGAAALGDDPVAVGDFDGDGIADLAMGNFLYDGAAGADSGRVLVVYAGSGPLAPQTLEGQIAGIRFGRGAAAGDVDGDGFDDLVVGSPFYLDAGAPAPRGRIELFRGSSQGLDTVPAASLVMPPGPETNLTAEFGSSLALADVDGDGVPEIFAGAEDYEPDASPQDTGGVFLVEHSAGELAFGGWSFATDQGNARLGAVGRMVVAGDVNGDQYSDLVVGAPRYAAPGLPRAGAAWLFLGSPEGLSPDWAWRYFGTQSTSDEMSLALGDVNGDGGADLVVGHEFKRVARLYLGADASSAMPSAGAPTRVERDEPFTPAGAGFTDGGANTWTCVWSFGDGTAEVVVDPCTPASAAAVSHTFTASGLFVVRLRVTDAAGRGGESAAIVEVR